MAWLSGTRNGGNTARVLLSAYRQRHLPRTHRVVRSVSADRLVDERTGVPYFLAKVEVDPGELSRLEDVRLSAGMPAEVMILTGVSGRPAASQ
jgi:HlyD family secretion protein